MWFVYILRGRDGSLYTGITTHLDRRLREHNAGKGGAYTRAKRPWRILFHEIHSSRSSASKREAQIKAWSREDKKRFLGS